uniref:Uncharacterized protein n=1 Tax=Acrobeloides nanus TaxID=290746 RepID=A0A914EPG1_9BILA
MLTALHLAAAQSMLPSKAKNTASMTNSNGSQNPHEKHFSAYDPAIRKNIVGLPVIHPGKIALATMNHVHNAQNGIYEAKNNGNPHEMIEDLPPWARGNPQPRSGKRGTVDWNQGQRTLPLNGAPILPSASSLYFNKPPMPYTESQHGSQSLLNSFGSTLARALPFPRQNHPPPAELYQSFASSYSPHSGLSPPLVHYPLQASNSYGNFYTGPTTSNAFITPAFNYVNPYPPGHAKHEKEQHKLELLQQIEDNRRRKEAEKQSEWEMEERERIRSEVFAARQRAEIEEEQRKQRNQAIAAERKAARIAESNPDLMPKNKARRPSDSRRNQSRRGSITSQHSTNGGLEWWEKKKTFDFDESRGRSPMIPTLNQRRNSVQEVSAAAAAATASASLVRRTPSPVAHRQRSASQVPPQSPMRPSEKPIGSAKQDRSLSRLSRRSYQPSIASRNASRLDDSLRNLSATHRQLDDEHNRVKQALENNNYDKHVFD